MSESTAAKHPAVADREVDAGEEPDIYEENETSLFMADTAVPSCVELAPSLEDAVMAAISDASGSIRRAALKRRVQDKLQRKLTSHEKGLVTSIFRTVLGTSDDTQELDVGDELDGVEQTNMQEVSVGSHVHLQLHWSGCELSTPVKAHLKVHSRTQMHSSHICLFLRPHLALTGLSVRRL